MSNVIRSLIVRAGANLSEAQKGFQQLARDAKMAGKELSATGRELTNNITLPVIAAGAASVKFASDYQESLNKVNVSFDQSANDIVSWSETTLKAFGLSKGTALDMAATYGDMATSMGFTQAAAADMSKEIVGRAADLSSFKNISIEVANTALTAIFTGETESLKKLGVVMTQANLDAYMLANGYKKTYTELSQQEQVLVRMQYVFEKTSNASGDFTRTQGSAANQARVFTESLKQAGISMGNVLLPAVTKGIKGVNGLVQKFSDMNDGSKRAIIGIAGIAAAIGPTFTIAGKLTNGIGELAKKAAAAGKSFSKGEGLSGMITSFLGPGGTAKLVITGIVVALGALTLAYREATRAAREFKNEAEDLIYTSKQLREEREKENANLDTNEEKTKRLMGEIVKLSSAEQQSSTDKAILKENVRQLNLMYDGLNLSIDESTGKLSMEESAIWGVIDATKEDLRLQKYAEDKTKYLTDIIELENEYADAKEEVAKAYGITTKEVTNAWLNEKYLNSLHIGTKAILVDTAMEIRTELARTNAAYNEASEKFNDMVESITDDSSYMSGSLQMTQEQMQTMVDLIIVGSGDLTTATKMTRDEFAATAVAANESLGLTQEQLDALFGLYSTTFDTAQAGYEEYISQVESKTAQYYSSMGGLFEKVPELAKVSKEELITILQEQVDTFSSWETDVNGLASRVGADGKLIVDDGLIAELRTLGPKSAAEVAAMATMTDPELAKYVELWRVKNNMAKNAATTELGGIVDDTGTVLTDVKGVLDNNTDIVASAIALGEAITSGVETGLNNKLESLIATSSNVATYILTAMKGKIKPGSPSKVTTEYGRSIADGLTLGIGQRAGEAIKSAASLAMGAMSYFGNMNMNMQLPALALPGGGQMNYEYPSGNIPRQNGRAATAQGRNRTTIINNYRANDPYGQMQEAEKFDRLLGDI